MRGGELKVLLPHRLFFPIDFLKIIIIIIIFGALGLRCCARLSPVAVSRGYSSLWCTCFSLWWLLLLQFPIDFNKSIKGSYIEKISKIFVHSNETMPHRVDRDWRLTEVPELLLQNSSKGNSLKTPVACFH